MYNNQRCLKMKHAPFLKDRGLPGRQHVLVSAYFRIGRINPTEGCIINGYLEAFIRLFSIFIH